MTESAWGGTFYDLKYTIEGKEYIRSLNQAHQKATLGEYVVIRYHKKDYYKIRYDSEKTEINMIVLFSLFAIANTILLIIFK